jgi:hypothetical protein
VMKKFSLITIGADAQSWPDVREILLRSGFGEEARVQRRKSLVLIKGDTDGGPVSSLRDLLRDSDLDWDERVRKTYDDADLAAAELLVMRLGQVERRGGIVCGTEYVHDTNCPACGGVFRQVGPLKIDGRDVKGKKVAQTYDHDWLVATEVAAALQDVAGLALGRVEDAHSRTAVEWRQLLATGRLPPTAEGTSGFDCEHVCAECCRTGHFDSPYEPLELRYRRDQLPEPLPSCCESWELYGCTRLEPDGTGSGPTVARPLLLVTNAVRQRLDRSGSAGDALRTSRPPSSTERAGPLARGRRAGRSRSGRQTDSR